MHFESRITWDKLHMELELLSAEDPSSLMPLLIGLNSVLWPNEAQQEWSFRNLNFMSYELMAKCEGYGEADRFHILNDYFFDQKGFQLQPSASTSAIEEGLLIKPILSKRIGAALPVTLIYLHLASHLDLPTYLVQLERSCILKWVRSGKSNYVDLSSAGKLLDQAQILKMINHSKETLDGKIESSCLDIIPSRKIFIRYVNQLLEFYTIQKKPAQALMLLDVLLTLETSNLKYLGQRALLRQQMGYTKEAIADLKRYFSFVDQDQAPLELQTAFFQLQSLNRLTETQPEIMH